ncbi:conserved hypothetical protein [Burkholderia sp. 8Y]|uniref:hypothetical protein n=1 Tax=Burkholderia sp. 8Y TaxID=2653133 RepID=UPI0012F0FB07|nr:hypothetical protein [Burkholderia sp. 8Y]VXB42216.1 conserved hypothetical protein [Burkholderia sp. 8Y]
MDTSLVLLKATASPGRPGRVTLAVANKSDARLEIVRSLFELKRTYSDARHALPRAGWGYTVTSVITKGTLLDANAEWWAWFHGDTRTTFGGVIPADAPAPGDPQLYLAGRILYRRVKGELMETAFYRRLDYADMSFSAIEPLDHALNYAGKVLIPRALEAQH